MGVNLVPDSDESANIGDKPLFKPTLASSVVVDNSTTPPGGQQPNTYKRGIDRDDQIGGPVRKIHGKDYMTHEETKKVLQVNNSEIRELAKAIYAEEKDLRRRHMEAQAMVNAATQAEIDDPPERLSKAMRILARGVMTQHDAKQKAMKTISKKALEDRKHGHM